MAIESAGGFVAREPRGALSASRRPAGALALLALLSVPGSGCPGGTPAPVLPTLPEPATVRALRVAQVTRGVPDPRPGRPPKEEEQVLLIAGDGERLTLEKYAPAKPAPLLTGRYTLRLDRDPPVVWEFGPDGTYVEHVGDLNKVQRDRDIRERKLRRLIGRSSRKERERLLADHHLKPDGTRDVTVNRGETKEILGRKAQRLVVEENGRVIIDAFVSEEVGGGRSFFNLYRRLGAFSSEVLEKIKDVRGLPLEGSITVVTKLTAHELSFEVRKIEEVEVRASVFELGDAKKVEPSTDAACARCGKRHEKNRMVPLRFKGRRLHFCDPDCRREFVDENF